MNERFAFLLGRALTGSLGDLKRDDAQTTVEYAIVLALVLVMIASAFLILQGSVSTFVSNVGTAIASELP